VNEMTGIDCRRGKDKGAFGLCSNERALGGEE
jgi:hypothetical protein